MNSIKYVKCYYENGDIIQSPDKTVYAKISNLGLLHRADGLAIEFYDENNIIIARFYYVYAMYIGSFKNDPKYIKRKINKILKQKAFE